MKAEIGNRRLHKLQHQTRARPLKFDVLRILKRSKGSLRKGVSEDVGKHSAASFFQAICGQRRTILNEDEAHAVTKDSGWNGEAVGVGKLPTGVDRELASLQAFLQVQQLLNHERNLDSSRIP